MREISSQFALLGLPWDDGRRIADALDLSNGLTEYLSAGVIFNNGVWEVQSETYRIWGRSTLIPDYRSTYLSVGYHIGSWTPYVLVASITDEEEDLTINQAIPSNPQIQELSDAAQNAVNFGLLAANLDTNQKSISLGIRYELTSKSAIKLQADFKEVKHGSLWTTDTFPIESSQDITLISATYEVIF